MGYQIWLAWWKPKWGVERRQELPDAWERIVIKPLLWRMKPGTAEFGWSIWNITMTLTRYRDLIRLSILAAGTKKEKRKDFFLPFGRDKKASTLISERRCLWERLKEVSKRIQGPWLVIGDFNNTVRFSSEKLGGRQLSGRVLFLIVLKFLLGRTLKPLATLLMEQPVWRLTENCRKVAWGAPPTLRCLWVNGWHLWDERVGIDVTVLNTWNWPSFLG